MIRSDPTPCPKSSDQVQQWIQAPDLRRGEQEKFSLFQAPGFIRGINPKSKIKIG